MWCKLQHNMDDMNSRSVDISVFPGQTTPETAILFISIHLLRLIYQLKLPPDLTSSLESVKYTWWYHEQEKLKLQYEQKIYIKRNLIVRFSPEDPQLQLRGHGGGGDTGGGLRGRGMAQTLLRLWRGKHLDDDLHRPFLWIRSPN